jgi:hypothetical protein
VLGSVSGRPLALASSGKVLVPAQPATNTTLSRGSPHVASGASERALATSRDDRLVAAGVHGGGGQGSPCSRRGVGVDVA